MKRTLFYLLIAGLTTITISSCQKQLDITPEGAASKGNFWKTSSDALKGANAMYELYDNENFYGRGFFWFINASDDMITGRVKAQGDNVRDFNSAYIGGDYTEDQWKMRYSTIKRANDVIRYVPAIEMDGALKNRLLGEAYFTSGYMYFQLAGNYGNAKAGVPIVTRENMDDPNPTPRAANVDMNYDYIISELKQAASHLPYFDELAVTDYGRPHKVAAWAVLSKVYLYKKDYDNAEKYADSVINFGKRDLMPEFADVFKATNNWGPEYIWSALSTPKGAGGWGSILPGVMLENKGWGKYNGWGYYMPTKELYDSYQAGDVRREATILKPGDHFMFFGEDRVYSSANSLSGYQFRKYMDPFTFADPVGSHISPNGDHPTTDLNVPLLRFAEVLLIKAEAAIMLRGAGAGDAALNRIRLRAKLTAVTGMSLSDLKRERRNELAGEWADRHRDMVRWGDAQAAYAIPAHGFGGIVVWPARKFNPLVHDVWAVPQKEIDNSGGVITQNAGW